MKETKICKSCEAEKETKEFSKYKRAKDGLQRICKTCDSIRGKERWINDKNRIKEVNKTYYINNINKTKEYASQYFQNNKEKLIAQRKERRHNSLIVKLVHNYRGLVSSSFKRAINGKFSKSSKSLEILGCSMEYFIIYIESKFIEGMTWSNYKACLESNCKVWQIDHRYPISLAENEEEIIRLCHYTNLQPMWAVENIKKRNYILD